MRAILLVMTIPFLVACINVVGMESCEDGIQYPTKVSAIIAHDSPSLFMSADKVATIYMHYAEQFWFGKERERLIPLHIVNEKGQFVLCNIYIPVTLLLMEKCVIDAFMQKTSEHKVGVQRLEKGYEIVNARRHFLRELASRIESNSKIEKMDLQEKIDELEQDKNVFEKELEWHKKLKNKLQQELDAERKRHGREMVAQQMKNFTQNMELFDCQRENHALKEECEKWRLIGRYVLWAWLWGGCFMLGIWYEHYKQHHSTA